MECTLEIWIAAVAIAATPALAQRPRATETNAVATSPGKGTVANVVTDAVATSVQPAAKK